MKRKRLLWLLPLFVVAGMLVVGLEKCSVFPGDGIFSRLGSERESSDVNQAATTISFDLLDEARPLDLIDMTLEFPESIRSLEGRRVRLIGFMAPYDSLNDMQRCMIVPSYVGCTFCTPPSLTQVVYVEQAETKRNEFPFIEPPSEIHGILKLSAGENRHAGHDDGFVYVIDEAVVTPYFGDDAPTRAPGHGELVPIDPATHFSQFTKLEELSLEALAVEVAELREMPPRQPLQFERVTAAALMARVENEVERSYPEETRDAVVDVFSLLGFFQESDPDWVALLTSLGMTTRIAWVDEQGQRIEVLDGASTKDPFTRLELVKEIADALARQHFHAARPPRQLHTDKSRALEGLRQGNKQITAYRYARQRNISPASPPPQNLFSDFPSPVSIPPILDVWHWLPWETGPFFVEARTGATKELSRIDALLRRPPTTTVELFRPGVYQSEASLPDLSQPELVDNLLPEPPVLVDRLGLGGMIPWLMGTLPPNQAKSISGAILTDQYALWDLDEHGKALLLRTQWPDQIAAQRFLENVPTHPSQVVTFHPKSPLSVCVVRAETEEGRQRVISALERQ